MQSSGRTNIGAQSLPSTISFLLLNRFVQTCMTLTKEIGFRLVNHSTEFQSEESLRLGEDMETARLRWRFSFVEQQALPFCRQHRLYRQGVALIDTRQVHSQGTTTSRQNCTDRTRAQGQKGWAANGIGVSRIGGIEPSEPLMPPYGSLGTVDSRELQVNRSCNCNSRSPSEHEKGQDPGIGGERGVSESKERR